MLAQSKRIDSRGGGYMHRTDMLLLKASISTAGGTYSFLFGGWPALVEVLLVVIVVDYVTGMMAAAVEGKLFSRIGFIGITRKVFMFLIVALAHQIDIVLGNKDLIRDATIYFYITNEVLSIVENSTKMGVPVPKIVTRAIYIFKGKNDEKTKEDSVMTEKKHDHEQK